jgi:hypothetical protein
MTSSTALVPEAPAAGVAAGNIPHPTPGVVIETLLMLPFETVYVPVGLVVHDPPENVRDPAAVKPDPEFVILTLTPLSQIDSYILAGCHNPAGVPSVHADGESRARIAPVEAYKHLLVIKSTSETMHSPKGLDESGADTQVPTSRTPPGDSQAALVWRAACHTPAGEPVVHSAEVPRFSSTEPFTAETHVSFATLTLPEMMQASEKGKSHEYFESPCSQ